MTHVTISAIMAGLVAALVMMAGPARAERPAAPAQPDQGRGFGKLPWQSWMDPAIARPRPTPQRRDRIVYAFDRPSRGLLTVDRELSRLCRQGRFNQLINLHYRAFGPDEKPWGVAYGRMAVNLFDPTRRRDEGLVYFFRGQETSNCTVYTARQDDLRGFYIGP
ncbi:hypothetical protein CHU95_13540 [Niveispirillum lacus]|uniref:Uncharacterized protein n=1 Tax=Niveispirillum lacus TaxID=1981099 RepID=A0A255YW70_9PROT|nr:hypothetical protein [Niveispirillum lacus]OYQ33429.1 hypothetical protein CHU95_13540 [Niveispirillum lacus]